MRTYAFIKGGSCIKILLLTHGTVDNLGDQTIEICADAMIRAVMENLSIPKENYEILALDACFVNKRFLVQQPVEQEQVAERLIQEADIIIYGGAPMFNYKYEEFAERTARTMDIIRKYSKPVIFSAIGVEDFETNNPVCKRLKEALNGDCVKMITTRDNYDALQKFTEGTNILSAKVSDSAVHTCTVFKPYINPAKKEQEKKKIGLFVIRGNAFKDNRIDFGPERAIQMWLDLAACLEARGYEYEFLTSGSQTDELLVERLIVEHGVDERKCVTNLNTPEELISKIASYDGMVSCRLHPSIIAYSLKIPAVALVWNDKVSSFYENIGYPERVMQVCDASKEIILERLEQAMDEGVVHEEAFLMSSYEYLFQCMKEIIEPEKEIAVFSYKELIERLPHYAGSDLKEKLDWKFARTYSAFNKNLNVCRRRATIIQKNKKEYEQLQHKYEELELHYTEACKKLQTIKEDMMLCT